MPISPAQREYFARSQIEIARLSAMERIKLEAECRANHIVVPPGLSDHRVRQLLLDRFVRRDKYRR